MEDTLFPYIHSVSNADRSQIKSQVPLVIWMTGYSGSGKSAIANALEYRLVHEFGAHTYLLDGDNVRTGLNKDLGFSDQDRKENIRRVGEVAKLMTAAGLIVITAFISPFKSDRDMVRNLFEKGKFWEIFVSCPLDKCIQRDPKGLYEKALAGKISGFTGVGSRYEAPLQPEIVIETDKNDLEVCVQQIIDKLLIEKIVQSNS